MRVHDFKLPELGKVAPMASTTSPPTKAGSMSGSMPTRPPSRSRASGVGGTGWASHAIPEPSSWLITADCGGSNGARVRLWKRELQRLANETGLDITVAHLPPGTSKWNQIEHRLFAYISQNWRGKPLVSHQVIVQLIGSHNHRDGSRPSDCEIDANRYPKGIKVTAAEMAALAIERDTFHGEWNYTYLTHPAAALKQLFRVRS